MASSGTHRTQGPSSDIQTIAQAKIVLDKKDPEKDRILSGSIVVVTVEPKTGGKQHAGSADVGLEHFKPGIETGPANPKNNIIDQTSVAGVLVNQTDAYDHIFTSKSDRTAALSITVEGRRHSVNSLAQTSGLPGDKLLLVHFYRTT